MIARNWMRGWGALLVAGTLALPAGLAAQRPAPPARPDRPPRENARECKCVDEQGNARERCVCFILPDVALRMGAFNRRAVLGVNVRHDQPARYDDQGVRLYGVDEESAAGRAGLEEGDILARVDGKSLSEPLADKRDEDRLDRDESLPVQRLLSILADHAAGDTLRVEYLRDGARHTATAVLSEPRTFAGVGGKGFAFGPNGLSVFGPDGPVPPSLFKGLRTDVCPSHDRDGQRRRVAILGLGRSCVSGVELLEMQPGLAEYFGATDGGVLVSDADDDNPLGLRAGDVLLAVDGRDVHTVDRALRVLRSYEGDEALALSVLRKQQTVEVKGKLR